jgi:hypothetical protein
MGARLILLNFYPNIAFEPLDEIRSWYPTWNTVLLSQNIVGPVVSVPMAVQKVGS